MDNVTVSSSNLDLALICPLLFQGDMVKIIGSEAVGLHIIKKILEKKQGLTGDEKV